MRPPRLPGTEKFRFCDKKYEQHKTRSIGDEPDRGPICEKVGRKDSFLFDLHARSLSNESLLCSCAAGHSPTPGLLVTGTPCALDDLISHSNTPIARLEHNKRKPHLPISSRSRVFTLTSYITHLDDHEHVGYLDKPTGIYDQFEHDSTDPLMARLPPSPFSDGFNCSDLQSCTSSSLHSNEGSSPGLSEAKCRLHSTVNLLHTTTHHMINSTSHASLMSDESSTSMSSAQRTECAHSYRSFSSSPIDHWAKHAVSQSRLSTSSQSSWEDGSGSSEVT